MRLIVIALVMLFVVLQYEFWFAKGSVISAWKLKDHISTEQAQNDKLKQRNDALRADIADLKSGNKAVEERARSELGMIKKGESFYQIVKHNDTKKH
jgi:cell division protein FtsB